jgi:hypothetical protein
MASSSSSPGLEEDRLLVALNAARDDVAAAYLAGGSVNTTISAARARGTVQISHDASEVDRMHSVIGNNDAFALEGHGRQAKKTKKYVEGRELMSKKAMSKADRESDIGRALERADARVVAADSLVARADARVEIAESSAAAGVAAAPARNLDSNSPELFGTGQSVLQWWAGWFSSCLEGATPKQINRKHRPSWYSAEIIAYVGYRSIVYAGVSTAGHCYQVS